MVESNAATLDAVFGSLADPVRRDMLARVGKSPLSVSQLAEPYAISLAAVSKHLKVLERAGLIFKQRVGKQQMVSPVGDALDVAIDQLENYKQHFVRRVDSLADYLEEEKSNG
ncbi:MAG: metalloregulator ArsR/SmtB family transcription factor [Solirubrobacterales bacterium]